MDAQNGYGHINQRRTGQSTHLVLFFPRPHYRLHLRLPADIVIGTKDMDLFCRKPRGENGFHRRFCATQAGGGYSYRYRAKLRPIHCPRPLPSRKYPFALQSDTIRHYAMGDYQADLSVSRDHWEPRWQTLFASTFSDLDTQRPIDNIRAFFT